MEKLKRVVYHNILNIDSEPDFDELIDKYMIALEKYCFDKLNNPIKDINLLKLIIQSFEFYYTMIDNQEVVTFDRIELKDYLYNKSLSIKFKQDELLDKSDYIFMYSSILTETYGKTLVNEEEAFFKKFMSISKLISDHQDIKEKIKRLS